MNLKKLTLAAVAFLAMGTLAHAQSSTGKATTAAPTYVNNSIGALSLDLSGNLRVVNGGSPSGTQNVNITAVGGNAVTTTVPVATTGAVSQVTVWNGGSITASDGVSNSNIAATNRDSTGTLRPGWLVFPYLFNGTTWDRTPGSAALGMSVNCVSGCVAGSGVSQGTATTAPPTYITGTNNPLSLDLAGGLRVSGNANSLSTDAGAPVKIGCVYNTSVPVPTNGQRVDCQSGAGGEVASNPRVTSTALADSVANTITRPVGITSGGASNTMYVPSLPYLYDPTATTWNRQRGDTNGAWVGGNVASGVADAGFPVKMGGVVNTTLPTFTAGQRADLQMTAAGRLFSSVGTLINGADALSNSSLFGYSAPGDTISTARVPWGVTSIFNGTTWDRTRSGGVTGMTGVNPQATPTGGATPFHLIAANSNNSTLVGSAGVHTVYSGLLGNTGTTAAWLKFYDKATAPTCGTDTPIATAIIPGAPSGGGGSNFDFGAAGLSVTLGLGICVVTGIADNDNTSVAAATFAINFGYK